MTAKGDASAGKIYKLTAVVPGIRRKGESEVTKPSSTGLELPGMQGKEEGSTGLTLRNQPNAHLTDLGKTLGRLGFIHSALGRRTEARAAYEEAVSILRKLAKSQSEPNRPRLAQTLVLLASLSLDEGRKEDAFYSLKEASATYRDFDAGRSD